MQFTFTCQSQEQKNELAHIISVEADKRFKKETEWWFTIDPEISTKLEVLITVSNKAYIRDIEKTKQDFYNTDNVEDFYFTDFLSEVQENTSFSIQYTVDNFS